MKLTKMIPARRKTIEFEWLKKDFCTFGEDWRRARKAMKDSLDKCFWCKSDFKDGDIIALGGCKIGNKVLCQKCAYEAEG